MIQLSTGWIFRCARTRFITSVIVTKPSFSFSLMDHISLESLYTEKDISKCFMYDTAQSFWQTLA